MAYIILYTGSLFDIFLILLLGFGLMTGCTFNKSGTVLVEFKISPVATPSGQGFHLPVERGCSPNPHPSAFVNIHLPYSPNTGIIEVPMHLISPGTDSGDT